MAIVFVLSLFTKKNNTINEKDTFHNFAESLTKRFMCLCTNYLRCDVVADRYLQDSIKENIINIGGMDPGKILDHDRTIPSDFKTDFLTHSQNKNDSYIYLAKVFSKILSLE